MKRINVIYMFVLAVLAMACRDESLNPIPTSKFLYGVTFTSTAATNPFLDLAKIDGAKMEFTTATTRPDLIKKVDVVAEWVPAKGTKVSKQMLTLNSVTGAQSIPYATMFTALGITPAQLNPGDVLRAKFVVTTQDGRTFSEDNTVGTLPSTGSSAFTRAVTATVACVFNPAQFATGTWAVVSDQWGDFKPGAEIKVKPGPGANDLTLQLYLTAPTSEYAAKPGTGKELVITVTNANTGAVKMDKQAYGVYDGDADIYSAEGTGSISGCAGTIDLTLKHTNNAGYSSGANPSVKISLKRK